jgi:hypothetical protein
VVLPEVPPSAGGAEVHYLPKGLLHQGARGGLAGPNLELPCALGHEHFETGDRD